MTRRLILMRHAKSSWDDPGLEDHARPLNKRGRRSARALGAWLRSKGYLPDEVLCSSSVRTQETFARLDLRVPVTLVDALYLAEPGEMMQALRGATGGTVLMLGHNPGIGDLAAELVARAPAHERFADYPTGATLVADFDIPAWPALQGRSGEVRDFVVPRELT